jgi:hypothetical protein
MPVDARIPLMGEPAKLDNLSDIQMRQAQFGHLQRQGQLEDQAIAENTRQAGEAQRVNTERATIDQLMQAAYLPDGTLNRDALREGAIKRGYGHVWPALEKQLNESDKAVAELTKLQEDTRVVQRKALALKAVGVRATGYDPQAFATALAMGVQTKLIPKEEAGQILAHIYENPALVKEWTDQVIASVPEIAKQDADLAASRANTKQTTLENQLLETTGSKTPPTAGTFGDYLTSYARDVAKKPVQALSAADKEAAKRKWESLNDSTSLTDSASALHLTPEALTMTAHQYAMTGQLPPMGLGKQGAALRTQIINEAAKIYQGLDLPSQVAAYTANKASLTKIQGQRDALGAFEETALKNLDVFLKAAERIPDTGSPVFNRPLRVLNDKMFGSEDVTAYNTARRTVIPEFAKILANPGLSGQLSDSARHEVEEVVNGNATLKQTIAAAKVLKQDAANRRTSYDDQIKDIQRRIATPPGRASTPATTGPQIGERRLINGQPATWDGRGWKAVP